VENVFSSSKIEKFKIDFQILTETGISDQTKTQIFVELFFFRKAKKEKFDSV
jgi:hypothetical protein